MIDYLKLANPQTAFAELAGLASHRWRPLTGLQQAEACAAALQGSSFLTEQKYSEATPLVLDKDVFYWLHRSILMSPDRCLPTHKLSDFSNTRRASLLDALGHMKTTHPWAYRLCKMMTPVIAWVQLRTDYENTEPLITSSSFPELPLVAWVSDKALRHIPPSEISPNHNSRLLAENLLHEAIHQAVNITLLLSDIFIETYSSDTGPTIPVKWRANQSSRQQNWELDRVLHAIYVYSCLTDYRVAELQAGADNLGHIILLKESLQSGAKALEYLFKAIEDHRNWFTPQGQDLLDALRPVIQKQLALIPVSS